MKKYNLLIIIIIAQVLWSCGGAKNDEESVFDFDNKIMKDQYLDTDVLQMAIKNHENKKIDSVVYFFDGAKIKSAVNNWQATCSLKNQKCGDKLIKAIIYYEGQKIEIATSTQVVSDIEPKLLNYKIVNTYNHDTQSFTEGLEFYNGFLYESSGLSNKSKLLKTDYKTGKILQTVALDGQYFAEGISVLNNKIYQLTWREKTGFVYDAKTMKLEKTFKYDKDIEGWGMANDGKFLYHNDSTERIWKMNPENLKIIDNINVYTGNQKVVKLNELEWVNGKFYSNIWQKDAIAIINANNGKVEAILNLTDLRKNLKNPEAEVLNGIAYNPTTKTLFVTGKYWDKMFEIKILD